MISQEFSSANTSINQTRLPKAFTVIDWNGMENKCNLDFGGGKFNNATEYLKKRFNVTNLIIDPYNRSADWNNDAKQKILLNGLNTATVLNVLNVIKEHDCRVQAIKEVFSLIKQGGTCYFQIYEGDKSAIGRQTKADCWQNNSKTSFYISEIETCFRVIKQKGNIITAEKN